MEGVKEDEISETSLIRRVEGARGGGGGFARRGGEVVEGLLELLAEDGGVSREGGGGASFFGLEEEGVLVPLFGSWKKPLVEAVVASCALIFPMKSGFSLADLISDGFAGRKALKWK